MDFEYCWSTADVLIIVIILQEQSHREVLWTVIAQNYFKKFLRKHPWLCPFLVVMDCKRLNSSVKQLLLVLYLYLVIPGNQRLWSKTDGNPPKCFQDYPRYISETRGSWNRYSSFRTEGETLFVANVIFILDCVIFCSNCSNKANNKYLFYSASLPKCLGSLWISS